jgi:hypothetical protein
MNTLFSWEALRAVAEDAFAGLILAITIAAVIGGALALAL